MSHVTKVAPLALALALIVSFAASGARAEDSQWAKDHPRRDQVNDRLANQNKRIHKEVKEGDITKSQAQQLHQQDKAIRQQERADAAQHGGHITKQEQKSLNQQENGVSQQIGH